MTRETLVLVGRESVSGVARRHADALRERGIVDRVTVATYGAEPTPDLGAQLAGTDADRLYAVPMRFAHAHETLKDVPRALGRLDCEVRYCDPLGESPATTEAIRARVDDDASAVLLVALGNSRDDHARDAAAFHADRLRGAFEEVRTAFLLQSPAVECARYTLDGDHAVVVPLFLSDCEATTTDIPAKLELDRGGFTYTDPLGDATAITDAIAAEVERERVLAESGAATPGTDLVTNARPVATDGRGNAE
ncbi:sirohydrochlorin chelatase [Halorubrum gandharaense]